MGRESHARVASRAFLFAAFVGQDDVSGVAKLYVLAPFDQGGGVTHVPNPMIELGVQASVPTPGNGSVPPAQAALNADLHLTVLGGTPLAWWSETSADGHDLVRYAAQENGGWSDVQIRTIDLSTGSVSTVDQALGLIEARLRRVVTRFTDQPGSPTIPIHPTLPGTFIRRR